MDIAKESLQFSNWVASEVLVAMPERGNLE
jgi:hypothetical protein